MNRPKVYISGPLTSSGEPEDNVAIAMEWCRRLIEDGFAPLCPHLTYYVDPDAEIHHDIWMEVDLPWVEASEAVFLFPGESRGAREECDLARDIGIPVYTPEMYDQMVHDLIGGK